jgi:hypothetical protein
LVFSFSLLVFSLLPVENSNELQNTKNQKQNTNKKSRQTARLLKNLSVKAV